MDRLALVLKSGHVPDELATVLFAHEDAIFEIELLLLSHVRVF